MTYTSKSFQTKGFRFVWVFYTPKSYNVLSLDASLFDVDLLCITKLITDHNNKKQIQL